SKASVIFTTYNQPEWLRKVLWGYECQTEKDFEIVIADDGSGEETKKVIDDFQNNNLLKIQHVWHPDEGYQKCTILNKAILATSSEYIIVSDGDCIPRPDFVETHIKKAQKGYFLSGGAIRLPWDLSKQISEEDIKSERAFDLKWLIRQGLPKNKNSLKLIRNKKFNYIMNSLTPARASWNGGNSSGWKEDFFLINGFNEEMLYGGEDREFGERLKNAGIKSKQLRFSAITLHLEHGRPYRTKAGIQNNKAIRTKVRQTKQVKANSGLNNHHA
ncbi:MAG: glycosyltransferase family 2 protein, partial [Bacteroidota bacterium]